MQRKACHRSARRLHRCRPLPPQPLPPQPLLAAHLPSQHSPRSCAATARRAAPRGRQRSIGIPNAGSCCHSQACHGSRMQSQAAHGQRAMAARSGRRVLAKSSSHAKSSSSKCTCSGVGRFCIDLCLCHRCREHPGAAASHSCAHRPAERRNTPAPASASEYALLQRRRAPACGASASARPSQWQRARLLCAAARSGPFVRRRSRLPAGRRCGFISLDKMQKATITGYRIP